MANSFFKNGDKAYSENLNDGILVGNAFDWTVDVSLPDDTGAGFPNSSTVVKAKVADVYITPNSNLSIGSSIENSSGSSQVYRLTVYPNFNRFGGFKSISLTADSGVTFYVANKGASAPIASNLDYSDLSNVPELKVLKEYDIVITIPRNKGVTGLEFVFQSSSASVSGSIRQSNVTGLNNTITAIQGKDNQQDGRLSALEGTVNDLFDLIYPVGSIYMSVNSTSPQTLFGGTWERIQDKFLLASGDTYTAGNTGGEATHKLTISEMPSHTHIQNQHRHTIGSLVRYLTNGNANAAVGDGFGNTQNYKTGNTTATNQNTGGGQAHNNMPPYLTVFMWKRTA